MPWRKLAGRTAHPIALLSAVAAAVVVGTVLILGGASATASGTSNGGTVKWASMPLPAPADDTEPEWTGLVCISAIHCVISGFDDNANGGALSLTTLDGGRSWRWRYHAVTPGVDEELDATICTARGDCLAMGSLDREELAGSSNWEATWRLVEPPGWNRDHLVPESLACSASECYVVGIRWSARSYQVRALAETPDAGRMWQSVALRGLVPDMLMACDPEGACWAFSTTGTFIRTNSIGVADWMSLPMPPFARQQTGGEDDYSCPSVRRCLAVSRNGVWISDDGGSHWQRLPAPVASDRPLLLPPSSTDYYVVDCIAETSCFLVGDTRMTQYLWRGEIGRNL